MTLRSGIRTVASGLLGLGVVVVALGEVFVRLPRILRRLDDILGTSWVDALDGGLDAVGILGWVDDRLGTHVSEAVRGTWEALGIFGPVLIVAVIGAGLFALVYNAERRFRRELPQMISDGEEDCRQTPQLTLEADLRASGHFFGVKPNPAEVRMGPDSITLVRKSGSSTCLWSQATGWARYGEANWTIRTTDGKVAIRLTGDRGWSEESRRRVDRRIAYRLREVPELT